MEPLKILIPTDFSVQAEYAFVMVKKLAEKAPVDIHFLHVLNVPETVTMNAQGKIETCGEIDVRYVEKQKEIAERKLAELHTLSGEKISTHLVLGRTTVAIHSFAEQHHFDLITMGTKGSWGIKEKVSGSETQLVARKSMVPVLSLMCDRSDLEINHILFAHDFQDPMTQDLQLMKKLIEAFQPQVHLLQIQKNSGEANTQKIHADMDAFATRHGLSNYKKHVLQDKDVESGVIHFNQMNEMDIICIGTHGKGGAFHTSATEKLINHMFKPIISFHLNG